ncbi:MAG: BamA/TamA family outer membrane protein [Tannerella sp.]|nr:BamA/TamA family outer membrane protein [Tannerella sp.]
MIKEVFCRMLYRVREDGGRGFVSLSIFCVSLLLLLCNSCSTTRYLPAGEQLYTGIQAIDVLDEDKSEAGDEFMAEIEAALSYPPNNALFGSSTIRTPIPFGLWVHNALVNKQKGLGKWVYKLFASKPVLISAVNPEVRTKIAQNLLSENGYFQGTAGFEIIPEKKDSLKAKIRYHLTMNEPSTFDSIEYRRLQRRIDTLLVLDENARLIRKGDQFNVLRLEAERQRIASWMRNNGYYFFRPDYIVYQADSTISPQKISLRVSLSQGLPQQSIRPWKIGRLSINLLDYSTTNPTDSLRYEDMTIFYNRKLRVRPKILYNQFKFRLGDVYSQIRQTQSQSALNQLNTFRYIEMNYAPRDTSQLCDTLDVNVNATYDLPLNGELQLNFTANSNRRIGPGAVFSLTKSNIFGGGESFGISVNGAYEWLIGRQRNEDYSLLDNYEYGATGTFTFPRVMLPAFFKREYYDFPASTTMQVYANRLNRAEFFRMSSFGGNVTYDFLPDPIRHHAFTPLRLTFTRLERTTEKFDLIAAQNPSLYQSLDNLFIPAISYTYTLDNSVIRKGRHITWWQFSVTEAGNTVSLLYALAGKGFKEEKRILGIPVSQFLKVTTELRYNRVLNRNHRLVTRIGGGIIYSYGNTTVAPYSEQFYAGGANSVRAFTIRTLGPGRFRSDDNALLYFDHTGDLKLEANVEYRFRLVGDMEGALFLDAGNVWLLREDKSRPGGTFQMKHFLNDIVTGTGAGIRYNLDVLILRLDVGVGLHLPYETERKGYFNTSRVGFHFAVGYPF